MRSYRYTGTVITVRLRRQYSDKRRWPAQSTAGWDWTGPTGRRLRTFTALRAVSSGERRSPGDASSEGAVGSLEQSAPCADDSEGPAIPRAAGVVATPWFERATLSRHTEGTEVPRSSRDRKSRSLTKGAKRLSNDHGRGCRQCRHPARRSRARNPQDDVRGPWFERRLREPPFVIPEERSSSVDRGSPIRSLPEIADCRRQRGRASPAREAS